MRAEHWTEPLEPLEELDLGTPEGQRSALDLTLRALRGMIVEPLPVTLEPLRRRDVVNGFLEDYHGHAGRVSGWRFAIGARDARSLVGVLVAGRAVAPATDPDRVLEITRLALLEGTPRNTASRLLGAACRAAKALGYLRVQTWLLEGEKGTAYLAAGFLPVGRTGGGRWTRNGRGRRDDERTADEPKTRWERVL